MNYIVRTPRGIDIQFLEVSPDLLPSITESLSDKSNLSVAPGRQNLTVDLKDLPDEKASEVLSKLGQPAGQLPTR